MKKIVLTFGLIAGVIIACLVWITTWLCEKGSIDLDYGMLFGYASMLVALSMVFFGIKSYRDNYAGGRITFWKGMQIGMLITVIAALMYFAGWMSYTLAFPGFDERFTAKYTEHTVGKMQASGAAQAEIDAALENAEMMKTLLSNPFIFFLIAMMEFIPVGLVVTLVSAALLRKSDLLPSGTT